MKSCNHYEAAFAHYLQFQAIPYISTRETKRCFAGQEDYGSLKNIDFLVMNRGKCLYSDLVPEKNSRNSAFRFNSTLNQSASCSWLIDIKGRRFPSGQAHPQYWRNWTSEDDLVSLSRWETIFGVGFEGLLVFAYLVTGERSPIERNRLFEFQNQYYAFFGVTLKTYYQYSKPLSPRWRTVSMPSPQFRQAIIPLDQLL